jgi:XTP/dITP diphosphohydrolase
MDLLVSTHNAGKTAEFARLMGAGRGDLRIISLSDLGMSIEPPEESGATFVENALIKARYYHSRTGLLSLADDSGLEVDALGGKPGVYSARYAGDGASGPEMIAKLLSEIAHVPDSERGARFMCALALVGDDVEEVFQGEARGVIAHEPQGSGGFGYDPIFIDPDTGRTFAELSAAEKAMKSHRGRALAALHLFLDRWRSGSSPATPG